MRHLASCSIVCVLSLYSSACSSVESVRLKAGYGPFSAEVEVTLRNAEALKAKSACTKAAAADLERLAVAKGAIPAD